MLRSLAMVQYCVYGIYSHQLKAVGDSHNDDNGWMSVLNYRKDEFCLGKSTLPKFSML